MVVIRHMIKLKLISIPFGITFMASIAASSSHEPSQTAEKKQQSLSQTRNPVILRTYKILSTNFESAATQGALQTLSDLYAPPIKGKEPIRHDEEFCDDDDLECLMQDGSRIQGRPSIEPISGDIAAQARKHLRRDMEKKLAESSHRFLKALGEVDHVRGLC